MNIKVLHIIDSGGMYGAEVMLLNLVREQQRLGLTPCIASIGDTGVGDKAIEVSARAQGIPVKAFRMRPGPNYWGARHVLRSAQQHHFTLLHSHGYKGNILFGGLTLSIRKIPILATVHGYTSMARGLSKMRVYEWLDRMVLRRLDAVVLVNQGMMGHPRLKTARYRRCSVIDNGIEAHVKTDIHPLDRHLVKFCDHPFVVGAVGRLSSEKGFQILVNAFAQAVQSGLPGRLLIIGEGRCRASIEAQVKALNMQERVCLPGFIEGAADYLPLFSLLCIPSLTEGLPITLLEAMRAGTPVIASQVGGIPHVVSHNRSALLTPPDDVIALKEAILRMYREPVLREELIRNAGQRFSEKYTSRQMAMRYLNLYRRILHTYTAKLHHSPETTLPWICGSSDKC